MKDVTLQLSEQEALVLYRHLHHLTEGQEVFCETYSQLQKHFFKKLTVEELTTMLEADK